MNGVVPGRNLHGDNLGNFASEFDRWTAYYLAILYLTRLLSRPSNSKSHGFLAFRHPREP